MTGKIDNLPQLSAGQETVMNILTMVMLLAFGLLLSGWGVPVLFAVLFGWFSAIGRTRIVSVLYRLWLQIVQNIEDAQNPK